MQPIAPAAVQPTVLPAHPVGVPNTNTPQQNKSRVFKSIDENHKSDKTKNYRHHHRDGGTVDDFA